MVGDAHRLDHASALILGFVAAPLLARSGRVRGRGAHGHRRRLTTVGAAFVIAGHLR
jgi:hypothetical protein